MGKALRIISVQAKDLYGAEQIKGNAKQGYCIRGKDGEIRLKKFSNTLDWSLDSMKLEEVYEKVSRRKNFRFSDGRHDYTKVVINVEFDYAYKEFNKAGANTYIRAGYSFQDCEISDGVYVEDGQLIAIQTNIEITNPISNGLLGKHFRFENGHYAQVGNIPTLMGKADLRKYLYKNGFYCDGSLYTRYKRSAGSSRQGSVLFCLYSLSEKMSKWDKCGLDIECGDPIKLAEYEAYIALPMSSLIDTIEIPPESILVVDDYTSVFEDEVIAVESDNGGLIARKKRVAIENSIWDGESLLDSSMFEKYPDKGCFVLRSRFFKTCAFNCNLQKWFADNNITDVSQLNGFTLAEDVSQIRMVTTPSSVKYLKFGKLEKWLETINATFGIVKTEKSTKYFGGKMTQIHYQALNSLQLSESEMAELAKPSLDYLMSVRSDPDVLRHHIKFPFNKIDDNFVLTDTRIKNEIVFKLLGLNNEFANTKLYKDFRKSLVNGMVRNLKRGHLLVNGNYSVLLGNGLELLNATIGKFNGVSEQDADTIYNKSFEDGEELLCSRSPHITFGNLLLVKNIYRQKFNDYFNMSNEIVAVTAINNNIQQRLNGADYDSDTLLLTNDKILINSAKKNYHKFCVPTNLTKAQKISRRYDSEDLADLDIKTGENAIGRIINQSQFLNSLYWQWLEDGASEDKLAELYGSISLLAALSNIEIDRAKKESDISSNKELKKLMKKYSVRENGKVVKPIFMKNITIENGYSLSDEIFYKPFSTSMDFLQKIIIDENASQCRKCKTKTVSFMDIIKKPNSDGKGGYCIIQKEKIINVVRLAHTDIQKIYIGYDTFDKQERFNASRLVAERMQDCVEDVQRLATCEYTMYITLREIEKKENADISRLMFNILFQTPIDAFYSMIRNSAEPLSRLIMSDDGDIKLYDFLYEKEQFCPVNRTFLH